MGTPWDRAAAGYLDEWVPRFDPYHLDLVRELTLHVRCARPGHELRSGGGRCSPWRRAVGSQGRVRATDTSDEMVRICHEQVRTAAFENVEAAVADARETEGGGPGTRSSAPSGLWQMEDRGRAPSAPGPRRSPAPAGKVGILTWGPPDSDGPFEIARGACVGELEPAFSVPSARVLAEREAMALLFDEGAFDGASHRRQAYTLAFKSAEHFVRAVKEACTWRRVWEELGDARFTRIAARFYEREGGPDVPLSFDSPGDDRHRCAPRRGDRASEHRPESAGAHLLAAAPK